MPKLVNNFGAPTATFGTIALSNFALRFLATVPTIVVGLGKTSADPEPKCSRLNMIMWFSFASGAYSGTAAVDWL